jgi:sulfoxide reductase heme-binding subunit YedZ
MTLWFTARGAGLAALVLLTAATVLGALTSGRGKPAARYVSQYLHRSLAGLGLGVLLLHVLTIVADSYAHVGVTGAIVPFTSGYRATWVGLGTIAAYLFLLTAVLGAARGRLAVSEHGARAWRGVHTLGYVAWVFALYHGFQSGTDRNVGWVRWTFVLCALAGFAAAAWRLFAEARVRPLLRNPRREATT